MKFYCVGNLISVVNSSSFSGPGYGDSLQEAPPSKNEISQALPSIEKSINVYIAEDDAIKEAIGNATYGNDPWNEGMLQAVRPIFTVEIDVNNIEFFKKNPNNSIAIQTSSIEKISAKIFKGNLHEPKSLWVDQTFQDEISLKYQAAFEKGDSKISGIFNSITLYNDPNTKRANREKIVSIQNYIKSNPEITQFDIYTLFVNFRDELGFFARRNYSAKLANVILQNLNDLLTYKQALEKLTENSLTKDLLSICLEYAGKPSDLLIRPIRKNDEKDVKQDVKSVKQ